MHPRQGAGAYRSRGRNAWLGFHLGLTEGGCATAIKEQVEAGEVKPYIDSVLALAEIKQALVLSEGGRACGKIVLTFTE